MQISVTDAARNFADCINRARYQNISFVLLKNGLSVAQLIPDSGKVCLGRDLAAVLAQNKLPEDEAKSWYRDLQNARKTLKAPSDRWQ